MLLDRQLSLIAGIVAATIAGLLAIEPIPVALYAFISCAAAVYGIKRYHERQSVTLAGLLVAAANFFMAIALIAFSHRPLSISAALVAGLFGIGGGLLTISLRPAACPLTNRFSGS
jgi:membrane-associated HD superfamily phosphohydrolase